MNVAPEIVNCTIPERPRELKDLFIVVPVNVQSKVLPDKTIPLATMLVRGRLRGLVRSAGRVVVKTPPESGTLPERIKA